METDDRDDSLHLYAFGQAREYLITHNGREYDSEAIAGVAHRYQFPEFGPLSHALRRIRRGDVRPQKLYWFPGIIWTTLSLGRLGHSMIVEHAVEEMAAARIEVIGLLPDGSRAQLKSPCTRPFLPQMKGFLRPK
jgi:hypothetical protein